MVARTGQEYVAGLKSQASKDVWIAGRKVADVTADPCFTRPIEAIAALYDLQHPPHAPVKMTARDPGANEEFGISFLVPRSASDLSDRRAAMSVWANATFGMVGRSPDYCNTVLMAFEETGFFKQVGADFGRNLSNYYNYCRSKDLFLTHAIVNPQTDRSKSSADQENPFIHLGVVDRNADGLIVRGAKMLATHGPTADELLVYPLPGSVRAGEEKYALAFGIPTETPGLKFICREPFDDGASSLWDHPLGGRFEEPDAMVVFDDVLIPWERVFLHDNVELANKLFTSASIQNNTGHQTAVRGLAKCQFMVALAVAISRSVKTDTFLHVQEQLGEILGYLQLIEGALMLSEQKAEATESGAIRPAWYPLQSLRYHLPRMYERMVQVVQVIGAGGLLINPTHSDLVSEIGADIATYYRGAGVNAEDRIHLSKLAWDATGTQFGQRMLQYERYYAGDPVRVASTLYMRHNVDHLMALVKRALSDAVMKP
ncbi:MAG: 4-hydroxyphenylacetate 3-hydroxylase N-terminal domain-containing protein [Pseudomonadota bacterium]